MSKTSTVYVNNGRTTLATGISTSDTSITVSSASAIISSLAAGQVIHLTLQDATNSEIITATGLAGNTFTGCTRAVGGTSAHAFSAVTTRVENRLIAQDLASFARLSDRMDELASVDLLVPPSQVNGNSYICGPGALGSTIVAVKDSINDKWFFPNYPSQIGTATLAGSGYTPTSIVTLDPAIYNGMALDSIPSGFLIQFLTGANRGQVRIFQQGPYTNQAHWDTPLPNAMANTDSFEVVKYADVYGKGEVYSRAQVDIALASNKVPAGVISMTVAASAPPGWIEADGRDVPRGAFSELFSAIGTRYGNGDGVFTFTLPDLRGLFPRFVNTAGSSYDPSRTLGSVQSDATAAPKNTAPTRIDGSGATIGMSIGTNPSHLGFVRPSKTGEGVTVNAGTDANSSGTEMDILNVMLGDSETRPVNIALLGIIKY